MVKKLGLTVPVIWDKNHVWANHFKPKGMPTTLILDKQARVIYRHEGFSQKNGPNSGKRYSVSTGHP